MFCRCTDGLDKILFSSKETLTAFLLEHQSESRPFHKYQMTFQLWCCAAPDVKFKINLKPFLRVKLDKTIFLKIMII